MPLFLVGFFILFVTASGSDNAGLTVTQILLFSFIGIIVMILGISKMAEESEKNK